MSQAKLSLLEPLVAPSVGPMGEVREIAPLSKTFVFRHFPQLDGLRGLAIVLVLAGHVMHSNFGIAAGASFAGLGVLLFFVLSGFLITGLLDKEKVQTGSIGLSKFYFRRVLRLFPALFVFLAVVCLLIKLRVITDTPWYAVLACLIYVRNIWGRGYATNHIWSLSVEEQFYASWPWIMKVVGRTNALRVAVVGTIAVSLFRMVGIRGSWFSYWGGTFYERPWFRFDSILIGCAIALWLCGSSNAGRLRSFIARPALAIILWPALFAWTWWGEAFTHVGFLTVQLIIAGMILVQLLLSTDSVFLRMLSHPVAGWLGKISYSWYLWQQLFSVSDFATRSVLQTFPLNVGASLLSAVISYYGIERPFLRLKDRVGEPEGEHATSLPWVDRAAEAL
jgi:peptidoglycan/LPS O-acetylase OafA/YrhL